MQKFRFMLSKLPHLMLVLIVCSLAIIGFSLLCIRFSTYFASELSSYLLVSTDTSSDILFCMAILIVLFLYFFIPRLFPTKCPRCHEKKLLLELDVYRPSYNCKNCGWPSNKKIWY